MTVQEARKQILWLKNDLDELRYNPSASKRMKEACDIARESMEKQIPKKPKEIHKVEDGSFYSISFMCPTCETAVHLQPYKPNHCKHCGQKIDWEEGGTSD